MFEDFRALQNIVSERGIQFGQRDELPRDRSVLANLLSIRGTKIGEGTLVRFVGYVLKSRYANLRSGESVNCRMPGAEYNDIRVDLVQRTGETDACASITAEISPHFRPSVWAAPNLQGLGPRGDVLAEDYRARGRHRRRTLGRALHRSAGLVCSPICFRGELLVATFRCHRHRDRPGGTVFGCAVRGRGHGGGD